MDKIIEFNKNDLFFEPVLCFYASWISFPFLYTPQGYPVDANIVIRGGWRGKIIPQLKYEDRNIYKNLQNLKPITKIKFFTDNTPAADSTGKSLNDAYLIEFLAQQMFGHAFEIATPQIKQKFGNNRKKEWPATIQFAYHIRNGCYHGNKFNILKNSYQSLFLLNGRINPYNIQITEKKYLKDSCGLQILYVFFMTYKIS